MRWWPIVLALASIWSVAPPSHPVAAAPSVQMTVQAGYEGLGKVGSWLPLEVDVRNDGPDINGEIQIVVTDTNVSRGTYTRAPAIYTAPAVLPRRAHKRILLEAELRSTGQKITARLVEGETVITEQDVQLTRVAAGDLLCGVLSRSGPAFDFLPGLELPLPLRRARIAHLDVPDLPSRPQLLASLDCLIFDNISTSTMLDSQREALSSWVHAGGMLITIGGSTWQKTFAGLPPELLPVKVDGLASLDNLDALTDLAAGEAIGVPGPWLVSQASLTDGNPAAEQDGMPLMAVARRGHGTVIYLAVDPSTEPLRSWAGAPNLWRYVLAHGAGGVGLTSSVMNTFAGWGRIPRNAMVDISALGGPTPGFMMVALALYALAVGPANYLFLKRFGRTSWSFVTIPLITAIAAVGTFTLAGAVRDSNVIVNTVSLVRGYPTSPLYGRTYVSVLSRQPAALDARANDSALISSLFFPFPRDPNPDAQGWQLKVVDGVTPMVSGLQLPAGSLGTFSVDSQLDLSGRLQSDLKVDGRQIVGTITNGLGVKLSDAALIVDYQVVKLGDLRSGESRDVSIALGTGASAGFGPPTSFSSLLYPGPVTGRRQADAARRDILDSAFGSGFNFTRLDVSGPTLLGWLDTPALSIAIADAHPGVVDNTLFISSLPVGLTKGYDGELPPQVVIRRQLGATTLNRQQYGSFDLASGESIAFQFSLPAGPSRFLTDGIYVNIDGRLRGAPSPGVALGEVSLYNWRRAEWEDRIVGFGRNLVRDPAPYISAAGDVRVRYTFKPPPDSAATGVSFSRFDVTASGLMR
ncbi:MAG: hypothetical protein IT305_03660 [Chloroflexi bacterium]|nr:hypothetical protein [Chloroflexota bacterium]